MTTRIELPSGAWADMRDPGPLKAKHRKQVARALHDSDRAGGFMVDLVDGAIAVLVTDWTVRDPETGQALPLPSVDLASLEELADEDYEALCACPLVDAFARRILKARTGADVADDPDGHDDPASPTAPSGASTPGSTEGSRKLGTRSPKSTSSTRPSGSQNGTAGTKTKSKS